MKENLPSQIVESIKAESKNAMLRKKTKYVHGMENFSSRKSAYKAGWNDCLQWVIKKLEETKTEQPYSHNEGWDLSDMS